MNVKKQWLYSIVMLSCISSMAQKKLFIFSGQSNMAGRASVETIDFKKIPNTYLLDDEGNFVEAQNPLNRYSNIRKETYLQRLGPVYSFARAVHKAYPTDTLFLVVNAKGGTSVERFMKNDASGYYKKTLARIVQAQLAEPTAKFEAFIWHQGESNRENYQNYLKDISKLIADYRKDLKSPKFPFIAGQLGLWNPSYDSIRNEISKIETTISNAFLASSVGLVNFDEHHFDSKSQRLLGARYAEKYLRTKNVSKCEILKACGASSFNALKEMLQCPVENYIMVAAHRGDWRNGPENSLRAVKMAVKMGVDIVELDIAMTKDSIPVLMHDKSLDRNTDCTGEVKDMTYAFVSKCHLKDGLDDLTNSYVQTLEEALILSKGKVLVNIDKGEDHLPIVYPILKKTGTVDQAIFSSYYSYEKLKGLAGSVLDNVLYMPKIKHDTKNPKKYLSNFVENTQSVILQIRALSEQDTLLEHISSAKKAGLGIWMNTLEPFHSAGHTDTKIADDPGAHLPWVLQQGATIIQTDRPKVVLDYLREKGLHY